MGTWRIAYKSFLVVWLLIIGFIIVLSTTLLRVIHVIQSKHIQMIVKIWYQIFLWCIDLKVFVKQNNQGANNINNKGAVVVANHVSWIDIIVLGSVIPTHFLSKAEVRKWPLIGWMAHQVGTLFIQRGGGGDVELLKKQMLHYVNTQQNILFFPEGKTGKGDKLMAFRPRLFSIAVDSGANIQPMSIKYGNQKAAHEVIPYQLKQNTFNNLLTVMAFGQIDVYVSFGQQIDPSNKTRDQLAINTQNQIASLLEFTPEQVRQRYQRKAQSTV
ncbi:MAG: 1-acyl-sn-glycerol-3-phosphate acyltransferase [Pseudomonadales bacterium]|nr:1-acyl-sn-glycerol-3-phosphate acyltransferase [Pseudomonadales bacterium]